MNKLLKGLFALLVLIGSANVALAVSIPSTEDPIGGPAPWLLPVYNNSGSTMDAGDVAVWDVGSSTGDNDNYITTTTTADTVIVAGVVYPADIAAGATGTIAVRGVVAVDVLGGGNAVGGPMCSSATAGSAISCASNANSFGFVTTVTSSGSANVYVTTK